MQSQELLDGAIGQLYRFVTRPERHLMILMPETPEREEIIDLLSGTDVRIFPVATAAAASAILREQPIDCLVIGPDAPTLDPQLCEPLLIDGGAHEAGVLDGRSDLRCDRGHELLIPGGERLSRAAVGEIHHAEWLGAAR